MVKSISWWEKVIDHEDKKLPGKNNQTKRGYLVRWKGYPPSEDTWEPEDYLKRTEACPPGEGDVTPFWKNQKRVGNP
jgi:hypothetical protein